MSFYLNLFTDVFVWRLGCYAPKSTGSMYCQKSLSFFSPYWTRKILGLGRSISVKTQCFGGLAYLVNIHRRGKSHGFSLQKPRSFPRKVHHVPWCSRCRPKDGHVEPDAGRLAALWSWPEMGHAKAGRLAFLHGGFDISLIHIWRFRQSQGYLNISKYADLSLNYQL